MSSGAQAGIGVGVAVVAVVIIAVILFFVQKARTSRSAVATANSGSVSGHETCIQEVSPTTLRGEGGAELDSRDVHEFPRFGRAV